MNPFHVCTTPIEPGLTLLEAGAGTGKTYSLVRIIARHLVEQDLKIDQILTVTFTRAATAEIKSRLHELLSEISESLKNPDQDPENVTDLVAHWRATNTPEFLEQAILNISTALANFDSVAIFTIDGFFQRLLKEFAFQANTLFSVELDTDEQALIQTALRDYWRQNIYGLDETQLRIWSTQIKFDDVSKFITEALRASQAEFDPYYEASADQLLKSYTQQWADFIQALKEHQNAILDFCQNPPAAFSAASIPFRTKGSAITELIDELLAHPDSVKFDTGYLDRISYQYLATEAKLKKNKAHPFDEGEVSQELIGFFKLVNQLLAAKPKHLKSAYLGDILRFVKKRLRKLKKEHNVQSYSDVTQTLADIFQQDGDTSTSMKEAIRQRFRAGLIDEFQDTSPQQCTVFLNLFHHPDLYFHIIGDPKQSIYRFRGADVFSYIQASTEAEHRYELLTNYRSSPRMIHAVNQVFSLNPDNDPFLVEKKIGFTPACWKDQDKNPELPDGPPALYLHTIAPEVGKADNVRKATCRSIAQETLDLLDTPWSNHIPEKKGTIAPTDIAVLTRTAKEAQAICAELNHINIPATLNTRSSLMESLETKEIFTILNALNAPRKADLLRTALLTSPLGSGTALTSGEEKEFGLISEEMAEFHNHWQKYGLMPMMLKLIQSFNIRTTLLAMSQGQRRITNFMHLIELLDDKARHEKLTPSATLQWLAMAMQDNIVDMDSEVLELRIATDADAVQILTQHTSKGLEFPIVFSTCPCPSDLSHAEPSLSYHDPVTLTPQFAAHEDKDSEVYQQRKQESYADAARLAYVALTRSKSISHFYIVPQSKNKPEEHAIFQMLGTSDESALQALAADSSGTIIYAPLDPEILDQKPARWVPAKASTEQNNALSTRDLDKVTITQSHRTTSFTGITRNTPEIAHDSDSDAADPTAKVPITSTNQELESEFWTQLQAGASLGLVFHETLEEIDFQNPQGIENIIENKLKKYSPWKETPKPKTFKNMVSGIESDLQKLLTHQLSEGVQLDQIPQKQRITEPEFLLSGSQFSVSSLSQVLAVDPPSNIPDYYLKQLQSLPTSHFDGFLVGFIDLIFEHNGRYHLLDWKTNRLPNYSQEALAESMAEHHYYLQYHLYTLALDRFLSQRLGDNYDPAQHLGSIYYVFLRGVNVSEPGSGIFTDKLSPNRLQALRAAYSLNSKF